ncbi:MAG: sulfur oxidation c-type cytochrome SoxA [Betaproteobacteria bacterium]|nr:sulfur oxidation c-type cytochrome SoxA [Betaproteobacteria bacterium]
MTRKHPTALWGGIVLAATIAAFAPATGLAAEKKAMAPKAAPLETEKSAALDPWKRYANWPQADWNKFNTIRNNSSPSVGRYQRVYGPIEDGNAEKGKKLVADRTRGGGCFACHVMPGVTLAGNVGPDLSTVGTWGRTDWYLFNYIYDPRVFNPGSMMPPWGAHGLYTPDEIRDIVAYLKTLKAPTAFKDLGDDPNKRVKGASAYDPDDPFQNPAWGEGERGEKLFQKPGPTGKSCASCHANPKKAFKTWAARMPYYEPRMKKVINSEEFITRHARAATGDEYLMESNENNALSIYLRVLGRDQPIQVKFRTAEEKAHANRGKELMGRKIGQLNFACNDCHGLAADKWIRGQYLGPSKDQVGHHPYYRTSQGAIWTIRKRMEWCGVAIRANELPPDAPEYADLEYYLTSLSNGKKVNTPSMGH